MSNWTKILEAFTDIQSDIDESIKPDLMEDSIDDKCEDGECDTPRASVETEDKIISELNRVFTPMLITQSLEEDISKQIVEACNDANVLTERNIIQFDTQTKMAQLVAICALLVAKEKNTPEYQLYEKAAKIRNQMKLTIQQQESSEAFRLAKKYLSTIANESNSSVARDAAKDILADVNV